MKYILLSLIIYFFSLQFLRFIESRKNYRLWIRILGAVGISLASVLIFFYLTSDLTEKKNFIISVVTALLLWLTWLGAVWTARETFDQKQIANKTIKEYRKQLEIEQQPYVIIQDRISLGKPNLPESKQPPDYLLLNLKNIGRGPAIRITVTLSPDDANEALFENNQPHSCDLGSGDEKDDWRIDKHSLDVSIQKRYKAKLDQIETNKDIYFYVFFSDQLGNQYKVRTKLWKSSDSSGRFLKVMENKKIKASEAG